MKSKSRPPRQPLSTRLVLARRDIARFAAFRQHADEEQASIRQHSKFSLLLLIGLAAVGIVAGISAIQLLEAAMR